VSCIFTLNILVSWKSSKQMIGEMSPDRSESFFRGLKEELHKLPMNLRSKA
jgi:hypothetical protein